MYKEESVSDLGIERRITKETFKRWIGFSSEVVEQTSPIVLVADANGSVGAGHVNQALSLVNAWNLFGIKPEDLFYATLDLSNEPLANLYKYAQQRPSVYRKLERIVDHLPAWVFENGKKKYKKAPFYADGQSQINSFMDAIVQNMNNGRPIIICTTHFSAVEKMREVLRQNNIPLSRVEFVEYVPDTWQKNKLRSMIATPGKERRITNSNPMGDPISTIYSDKESLPYGMLQDIRYLTGEVNEPKTMWPFHIEFDFTGNASPDLESQVRAFILTYRNYIESNMVRITIQCMHHQIHMDSLQIFLKQNNFDTKNIRILCTPLGVHEGVVSRDLSRTGFVQENGNGEVWPAPHVMFSKGEGPLTHNDTDHYCQVNASAMGEGHERDNAIAGEFTQQALFLIDTPIDQWLTKIINHYIKLNPENKINATPSFQPIAWFTPIIMLAQRNGIELPADLVEYMDYCQELSNRAQKINWRGAH